MKTTLPKVSELDPKWVVVDADGKVLGRLAVEIARILRGKNKPTYTPHLDTGDYVVVINAEKVVLTGNKEEDKMYQTFSGYRGGQKEISVARVRATHPERLVEMAVKGMLPKNRLGRQLQAKLKVYAGSEHPHGAQNPEAISI